MGSNIPPPPSMPPYSRRTSPGPDSDERSFARRWGHAELFKYGFVPVPVLFLRIYTRLKPEPLTTAEAMFVLHLMEFKWDSMAPFPSYKKLADRMGVTDKAVRRHAKSLEKKGYLRRIARTGQTSRFDLKPLFAALLEALEGERRERVSTLKERDRAARAALGTEAASLSTPPPASEPHEGA